MSADEESGAGRREVAYRVFAAEYDDADLGYTENEADERAPNYVVTPTGGRVNRLFVVGVLTEVERVNSEMLRGRVVDPTGAFVVYAGQYEPGALSTLERLDPPAFVATTGKARTFQPDDAETVYTSVRPESINEVDADTRDRWTVGTARHTLDRVGAFADALDRQERGEELATVLSADGVEYGLASGISLALGHYSTTPGYLDAVREMAVEAVEVVAGEREEVTQFGLAPDTEERTDTSVNVERSFTAVGGSSVAADSSSTAEKADDTGSVAGPERTASGVTPTEEALEGPDPEEDFEGLVSASDQPDGEISDPDLTVEKTPADTDGPGVDVDDPDLAAEETTVDTDRPDVATDEMDEFDEGDREEIESEFGTDFSTGTEVGDPGESDLDVSEDTDPTAETGHTRAVDTGESETPTGEQPDTGSLTAEESDTQSETSGNHPADVDLEDAVVEVMRDLDSGDGADRDAVIEAVAERHGAEPGEVEDAIQEALMSGTCYEPGDGLLKAI